MQHCCCYASSSYLNGQMGLLRPQSSSILCSSFSLFEHAIVTSILWLAFFPSAMLQLYYTGRPFKPTVFEDKVFKTIFVNILQQLALSFLCRMCIDKLVKKSRNFFPINGYVMKSKKYIDANFFSKISCRLSNRKFKGFLFCTLQYYSVIKVCFLI